MHSIHSLVHVFHEERVMKVRQIGAEERPRLRERMDASLDKELRKHRVDSKFRRKPADSLSISIFAFYPFLFYRHSIQR